MNSFLARLIARARGDQEGLRPALPSRFEPAALEQGATGELTGHGDGCGELPVGSRVAIGLQEEPGAKAAQPASTQWLAGKDIDRHVEAGSRLPQADAQYRVDAEVGATAVHRAGETPSKQAAEPRTQASPEPVLATESTPLGGFPARPVDVQETIPIDTEINGNEPTGSVQGGSHERIRPLEDSTFFRSPLPPEVANGDQGVTRTRSDRRQQESGRPLDSTGGRLVARSERGAAPKPPPARPPVEAIRKSVASALAATEGGRVVADVAKARPQIEREVTDAVVASLAEAGLQERVDRHSDPEAASTVERSPIQVTIGRIEVRAPKEPAAPAKRRAPPSPRVSLDDYLKQANKVRG